MAMCGICTADTGDRSRMHSTPDCCLKAIDAEIAERTHLYRVRLKYLRQRRRKIARMRAGDRIANVRGNPLKDAGRGVDRAFPDAAP